MKPPTLTPARLKALQALAFCQYLTPDQFVRWGIGNDKSNIIRRALKPLRDTKPSLVHRQSRGAAQEDVYCLTRQGAILLSEATREPFENITFPKDGIQFTADFSHRRSTIGFLIELHHWARRTGTNFDFVDAYYTKTGAQRSRRPCNPITRHRIGNEIFEPDLVFRLQMPDQQHRLFACEYHNGSDSSKIEAQLLTHTRAIAQKSLSQHYRHAFANYVLSVYRRPSIMKAVMKRCQAQPGIAPYAGHFLFNTLDKSKSDFANSWTDYRGVHTDLFSRFPNTEPTPNEP